MLTLFLIAFRKQYLFKKLDLHFTMEKTLQSCQWWSVALAAAPCIVVVRENTGCHLDYL